MAHLQNLETSACRSIPSLKGRCSDTTPASHVKSIRNCKWMIAGVLDHPDLQGLRRMILATSSAHGLYPRYGFTPLRAPEM